MTAYTGVAGQLGAMQGHALDNAQALSVMAAASAGAEATGESLSGVTKDLANVMQSFQIPVSGAKSTMDELYATSRATGVGLDSLSSTMDRLKSRLGVAAPTVGDMGTMLVDLGEHGVSGSKGLLVVNTAITSLLKSTSTMDAANAKAAGTYETKMASAQAAVTKASEALATAQDKAGLAGQKASLTASNAAATSAQSQTAAAEAVTAAQQRLATAEAASATSSATAQAAAAKKVSDAQSALAAEEARIESSKKETISEQLALQKDQMNLQNAQDAQATSSASKASAIASAQLALQKAEEAQANKTSSAQTKGAESALSAQGSQLTSSNSLSAAQEKLAAAQAKLQAVQATGSQSTNANVQAMQQLGLQVYNSQGKFVGMGSVIDQLQPKLKAMTQQQQLQALSSVFGTSANKALLDTVLAGPAAWDKAQKAVMAHNAAEVAAAKQNQSLGRELDIVKAQVIDLGTKFGLALLPVLSAVGKAIGGVIDFFEHNKGAAIALGLAIAGPLAAAMTVFAVQSVGKAVQAVVGLGDKMLHLGSVFTGTAGAAEEQDASTSQLNATLSKLDETLGLVQQSFSQAAGGLGELTDVEQSQIEVTASIQASNEALAESYAAVEEAQTSLSAGFAELEGAEDSFAATSEATGEASSAAFGPVGIAIMALVTVGTLVATHWKTISKDFLKVWGDISSFAEHVFGDLEDFFKKWGTDLLLVFAPIVGIPLFLATHWRQVLHDAEAIWGDILGFFKQIPNDILSVFTGAGSWLLDVGKDLLKGLWTGFTYLTPEGLIIKFHSQILSALSDVGSWLLKAGEDLLNGLWHGIEAGASVITGVGKWILNETMSGLSSIGSWLLQGGKDLIGGLWKGIEAAASVITGVGKDVEHWIIDAFKDAGKWLLDAGEDLIKGLIKGATEAPIKGIEDIGHHVIGMFKSVFHIFSPSKDTEEIGKQLVAGLEQGLNNTDVDISGFTKMFNKIVPAIQKLTSDLSKSLSSVMTPGGDAMTGWGQAVTKGIDDSLKPATAIVTKFGQDMTKSITDPLNKSVSAVTSFGPKFLQGFQALNQALAIARTFGPALVAQLNYSLAAVGLAVKTFAPNFVAGFKTLDTALAGIKNFGSALKSDIENPLKEAGKEANNFGADVRTEVIAPVQHASTELSKLASTIDSGLARPITQASAALVSFGPNLHLGILAIEEANTEVASFGPNFTKALVVTFTQVGSAAKSFSSGFSSSMKDASASLTSLNTESAKFNSEASAFGASVRTGLITPLEHATSSVAALATSISSSFQEPITKASDAVTAFGPALEEAVTSIRDADVAVTGLRPSMESLPPTLESVTTAAKSFEAGFSDAMKSVAVSLDSLDASTKDAGVGMAQGLIDGLNSSADAVQKTVVDLATNLMTDVTNTAGHDPMYNLGVAMAQGLIDGLNDSRGAVDQTMVNVGNQLLSTMKNTLGVHSPSTIFAAIGTDTLAGLTNGFVSGTPGAVQAMTTAANRVTKAFSTGAAAPAALPNVASVSGPGAAAGASGTGAQLVVQVTVQGNVMTEADLETSIWRALMERGIVNGTAGQLQNL